MWKSSLVSSLSGATRATAMCLASSCAYETHTTPYRSQTVFVCTEYACMCSFLTGCSLEELDLFHLKSVFILLFLLWVSRLSVRVDQIGLPLKNSSNHQHHDNNHYNIKPLRKKNWTPVYSNFFILLSRR